MKYKFEKSKYPIFKIAFWILLFCSIFLFLAIAKNNAYKINIKNHPPILKPISVNVEFERNTKEEFFVCFDEFCKPLETNSLISQKAGFPYVSSVSFNIEDENFFKTKIKNVYFAIPKDAKNLENKINNVNVFISNELYYYNYSDVKKLENKKAFLTFEDGKNQKEYVLYTFKNSNNYIGLKNHLMTLVLSFVFKMKLYFFPCCWLFVSLLIFLFNKDAFRDSFKKKAIILTSIFSFLALIMLSIHFILPKENDDIFDKFIENDIKNVKDYNIQVISFKNKTPKNLKNKDITWHYINSDEDKISKLPKEEYAKNNEKTIIYFDSKSADIEAISLFSARAKIYYANYSAIGKLTYN